MTGDKAEVEIAGMDLFFQSDRLAKDLAEDINAVLPDNMELVSLTNRGTVVWPNGSVYTECSTGYGARIKGVGIDKQTYWEVATRLNDIIDVSSTEFLNVINGQRAYSLGQGK
jgi:isocitrate dehydrogenase